MDAIDDDEDEEEVEEEAEEEEEEDVETTGGARMGLIVLTWEEREGDEAELEVARTRKCGCSPDCTT